MKCVGSRCRRFNKGFAINGIVDFFNKVLSESAAESRVWRAATAANIVPRHDAGPAFLAAVNRYLSPALGARVVV